MNFKEYQHDAKQFAAYAQSEYPFLALGEEAGEVLGKLAKYSRKYDMPAGSAVRCACNPILLSDLGLRDALVAELGDVLWQLSACAGELGLTLEEVAEDNIRKLEGRTERGTIVGSGDDR